MFSSNIRIVYLYVVVLITLGMMIGGLVGVVYNTTELLLPDKYIDYSKAYDYDEFYDDEKLVTNNTGDEQAIRERAEKIDDIKNIIYSATVTVIALPFFVYHWKRIEKERLIEKEVA